MSSTSGDARTLIGPAMYRPWKLAMGWTLGPVLPLVLVSLVVVTAVHQSNLWVTVFRPLGITLLVAACLSSGVTWICAVVDRTRARRGRETSRA